MLKKEMSAISDEILDGIFATEETEEVIAGEMHWRELGISDEILDGIFSAEESANSDEGKKKTFVNSCETIRIKECARQLEMSR